jgi:hypothetical protein
VELGFNGGQPITESFFRWAGPGSPAAAAGGARRRRPVPRTATGPAAGPPQPGRPGANVALEPPARTRHRLSPPRPVPGPAGQRHAQAQPPGARPKQGTGLPSPQAADIWAPQPRDRSGPVPRVARGQEGAVLRGQRGALQGAGGCACAAAALRPLSCALAPGSVQQAGAGISAPRRAQLRPAAAPGTAPVWPRHAALAIQVAGGGAQPAARGPRGGMVSEALGPGLLRAGR